MINGLKEFSKSFTVFAVFFIELDASLYNFKNFILAENTVKLFGQPRMSAQFSPQLNPETLLSGGDGSGGTDMNTLAAFQAFFKVDFRYLCIVVDINALFRDINSKYIQALIE